MAWTHVQGIHASSLANVSFLANSAASAVGTGNAICGIVSWDDGALTRTLTSVKDNAGTPNTYNLEATVRDTTNGQSNRAFSLGNIQGNPTILTATFSTGTTSIVLLWDEYSFGSATVADPRDGVTGQWQTPAPGTGTDAVTSGNASTTVDGDLIYGVTADTGPTGASTITAGTNFTLRTNDTTAGCPEVQSEDRIQATHSATTPATFTTNSTTELFVTFVIALKPPASGDVLYPQSVM